MGNKRGPYKPTSPEVSLARRRQWERNSFLGHVAMGRQHMNAIANHDLVDGESKVQAMRIRHELDKLDELLRRNKKDGESD